MTKEYNIQKPEVESGYLVQALKYLTLSIITYIVVVFVVLYVLRPVLSYFSMNMFLVLTGLATFYVYLRYFLRKAKLSRIYGIKMDYDNKTVSFKSVNNYRGKEIERIISFSDIKINVNIKDHPIFGRQRELIIFDGKGLVNTINLEMTSWHRHEKIDEIIESVLELDKELVEYHNEK